MNSTMSIDKMNSAKRFLLTAGAILAFIILFALFGLIFYQLFKPGNQPRYMHQNIRSVHHSSSRHHQNSNKNRHHQIPSTTPVPSTSPPFPLLNPEDSVSDWSSFKRLWKANGEKERAHLLVQNINMNPNSTWNARVNKYTIGLKPLSEMVNFTDNFDPLNSTFMMDPNRLKDIEQYLEKSFYPLYDRHILALEQGIQAVPDRFNAAQRWGECAQSILRVRDQGGCGSCWAVAAISVISDRICIATDGRNREGLSTQQLVECCDYCGGCTGAPNSFFPFLYWHQQGLVSDQCFPYSIARDCGYPCPPSEFHKPRGLGNCSLLGERKCANPKMKPKRHKAKYVYKLGTLDEEEINFFPESLRQRLKLLNESGQFRGNIRDTVDLLKREIMAHGPVMLCFSVFESFMHYHDGVYNFDLQPGELHVYDHCAKIIGWGRQRKSNTIGVQPYLIAVNSWSSLWAKDGTFKLDLERLAHFHSDLFAGIP